MTVCMDLMNDIHSDYFNLIQDIEFFDMQIKINQAWEIHTSVDLKRNYSNNELILLHGIESGYSLKDYQLQFKNNHYQIKVNNEVKISFSICPHMMYSPVELEFLKREYNIKSNHCLQC